MSAPSISPFPDPPAVNLVSTTVNQPQPSESIDSILAQSMLSPVQPQQMVGTSGSKEVQPIPAQPFHPESAPLVELKEVEKLPVEVEGYLQKLDQAGEIRLEEPITHDGDVLLADSEAQVIKEKIVLPMTQSAAAHSQKSPVTESARWLAEWCVRLIKMMKDGVKYAEEPRTNN